MHGPTTGIHAYPQSDEPLPEMGKIACAILGARSRAGLIAYPVVPPSESPIPHTSTPTRYGPIPTASSGEIFAKIDPTPTSSTVVPMISLIRFAGVFRIAGPVQNTASFAPWSCVSFQCGK